MKKANLSERLTKKTSIIVIIAIALFLIAGILVAVLSHKAYISSREAKIVNVSTAPSDRLHFRSEMPDTVVYKYPVSATTVDLNSVLRLSDNATMSINKILNSEKKVINSVSPILNVENSERYFVFISVTSLGNLVKQDYFLEIVSEKDYSEDFTYFDGSNPDVQPYIFIE